MGDSMPPKIPTIPYPAASGSAAIVEETVTKVSGEERSGAVWNETSSISPVVLSVLAPRTVHLRQDTPSGAKRRWAAAREDGGAGQGAAVPCPASAHRSRSANSAPNRC